MFFWPIHRAKRAAISRNPTPSPNGITRPWVKSRQLALEKEIEKA